MAKKNESGYLSAKESRRISRENRKITDQFEKLHKRKNVPEEEFLTQMHDQNNSLEIENLHTYFFSDVGTVRAVDGVSFDVPIGKTVGDRLDFGGLLGYAPVMPVNQYAGSVFAHRGGRMPAPLNSLKN